MISRTTGRTTHRTTMLLTFLFLLVVGTVDAATAQPSGRGPANANGAAPALPSVDEMAEAISATPTQRAALAEARLEWTKAQQQRRADRGPGERGAQRMQGEQSPMMGFLAEVGAVLDVDETLALVELLEQKTAGLAAGRGLDRVPDRRGGKGCEGCDHGKGRGAQGAEGQGPGQGEGKGMGRGHGQGQGEQMLVKQLDLTDEQETELEALHASTLGALRALRTQVGREDGEPTQAQLDEASRLRAEHQTRVQAILTAEQHSDLLRLRAERRAERAQQSQERFTERKTERLEHLTAILDLDARQREQVSAAIDAGRDQALQKMAERWEEGGPMPGLFDERGPGHGESMAGTLDGIREVLQPKQRELLARVQALAPVGASVGGTGGKHGGPHHEGPGGQGRQPRGNHQPRRGMN